MIICLLHDANLAEKKKKKEFKFILIHVFGTWGRGHGDCYIVFGAIK